MRPPFPDGRTVTEGDKMGRLPLASVTIGAVRRPPFSSLFRFTDIVAWRGAGEGNVRALRSDVGLTDFPRAADVRTALGRPTFHRPHVSTTHPTFIRACLDKRRAKN